jgi:hypothetical protein
MTDEELIARFYSAEQPAERTAALQELSERYHEILAQVVHLTLVARTGAPVTAPGEWDIDDRVQSVWAEVFIGRSGHGERFDASRHGSVLAWLFWLAAREVDRHLPYP